MPPMPEYFRLLDDAELEPVRAWNETLVSTAWDEGLDPVDGALRGRIVYEFGGAAEVSDDHLRAMAAAALVESDASTLIVDGIPSSVPDRRDKTIQLAALEVDFENLRRFCATTDLVTATGDDPWLADSLADWPADARSILDPDFVDGWSMMSPLGRWAFGSYGSGDDNWIVGSQGFLNAYLDARPEVIYDVLLWMHGDGSFLASGSVTRPRKSIWRWISPVTVAHERNFGSHMKGALERFYPPDDAKWIWDVYVASDDAFEFPWSISWEDREEKLMQFFKADPEIARRLEEIWRGI